MKNFTEISILAVLADRDDGADGTDTEKDGISILAVLADRDAWQLNELYHR